MVDAVTLTIAATVIQTGVLSLTLMVFVFQFRSQEKAIKESAYQSLRARYNDFMMSQLGTPQMARLLADQEAAAGGQPISSEDAAMAGQMMVAYGILEEAHELYSKRWIDRATWDQWDAWLRVMCQHPVFRAVHNRTKGMYNDGFERHVADIVEAGGK